MVLVIHITVAVISVLTSFLTVLSPTRSKIRTTQFLTLATLASGVLLVIANPTTLGTSCISGILYLGLISTLFAISHRKLAFDKRA